MRTISFLLLFALSITTAYGQETSSEPRARVAGEAQPDTSGERLKDLRRAADNLERAGDHEQAATIRKKAEQERQALLAHVDRLQAEVDQIRRVTGGVPQVMVHLKVFEVSLTKLHRLGYNLAKLQGKTISPPGAAKDDARGFSVVDDGEASRLFESLRKDNLAKVLAEPTLVTTDRRQAMFNTGGKILLPQPQKDGSMRLEWQQYGTQVELTPHVQSDRTVRLSLHFRLSELDHAQAVRVGKDTFPGLQVRELETNTELRDGQTVVLGGLTQVRVEASETGVPVASSIPYIGSAFKSVKEERNETGMFMLVQPEIVEPSATVANHTDDAPETTASRPAESNAQR